MTQRGDAGFKYTDPDTSKEVTVRLQGELRDISAQEARTRFTRWSVDNTARDVVTVGSRARQVKGTVRYQGRHVEFAKMLDHGLNGVTLNYYQSLQYTRTPIPCQLVSVNGSADVQYSPDPSTWFRGEHSTELLLRRVDGDSFDELLNFVVLRYYPGLDNITHTRADASAIATYVDSFGVLRTVADPGELRDAHYINGVRHTLLEPQRSNKCQYNYLYGTNGTTGWTLGGDAAATMTAVTDSSELTAAGLGTLASDGYVLKLDNSGGTTPARASASGTTGNTNIHYFSAYVRGGSGSIRRSGTPVVSFAAEDDYTRVGGTSTPAASTNRLDLYADAGQTVYFVLAQMEEGRFITTPIRTQASTVTRAADVAYIALPSSVSAPTPIAVYLDFVESGTVTTGTFASLLYIGNAGNSGARLYVGENGSGKYRVIHNNGSTAVSGTLAAAPSHGDHTEIAFTFGPTGVATLLQSVEEAAITSAASSALDLASAWGDTRLYLNSSGTSLVGALALREVKVAYRGGRMPYEGTASAIMQSLRDA